MVALSSTPFIPTFPARRMLLTLVIVVGVLSLLTGMGTLAYFTSNVNSADNTFSAGAIQLLLTDSDEPSQANVTASISESNMKPGEWMVAPITVENAGSLGLTYGLTYEAADSGTTPEGAPAMMTQLLDITVKAGNAAGQCNAASWASWPTTVVNTTGLGVGSTVLFLDTSRTVGAGGSEVLCFRIDFPDSGISGSENAAMGGTSTLDFTFSGRQN